MLYDKNRNNHQLDLELFKNPTAEYRGTPFWAWNCELDEKELLRQIDVFKEMGLGGFHMHVRTGMATAYLSDEFMKLIKSCTEHAKKNNMLSWLYDEDRWPSGAAGGIVTKNPEFRQRMIRFSCDPNYKMGKYAVVLGKYDVVLDENKTLSYYKKLDEGEAAKGTVWTVYRELAGESPWYNNQTYVDTLNPKAMQKFIEVTHDAYAEAVGDEFGKTIPAIFTDEPQFVRKGVLPFADSKVNVNLPWTDDFEDTYKAAYGESIIDKFPELLWDLPDGAPSLTRYRYHDHITERFTEAFADQCGKWCDEHGIMLTGHMMEEPTLHSQTSALGEAMRAYRGFKLPGIDMLCSWLEYTTAKQAQSAVHQYGREGMLSELYGVTGWDFDFRGHKIHGDWQAALGVTVRVQHLSWVSMKGNAKRDYPASISYQSSWHKEYAYVEDHFARVNTALTRGTPVVKVGVIHPVQSYWLRFGPQEQTDLARSTLEQQFHDVTNWLLKGSIDFDYICESLLPEQCEKGSAPLQVGKMAYDVIVVPECETIRATTLDRLEAFLDAGGKLIFMGDAPKYVDAIPSDRGRKLFERATAISFSRGALLAELAPYRVIDVRNANGSYSTTLLHQLRRDTDGMWLFLAHTEEPRNMDVSKLDTFRVTVMGKYTPELWDTITGDVKPVEYRYDGNNTVITLKLYEYDSALLYLRDGEGCGYVAPKPVPATATVTVPATVSFSLDEPNVLLLDMARYALDDGELQPVEEVLRLDSKLRKQIGLPLRVGSVAQPWVIEKTEPRYKVTLEFEIESEIDIAAPVLALEDADIAEITFNGEKVTYADLGFYTDMSIRKTALPPIKAGKNVLTIKLPFDERTNVEACYLLGDFGVKVNGRKRVLTAMPTEMAFDDIVKQGLPYYGGAVTYRIPIECDGVSEYTVATPHYRAGVLTYELDGEKKATVAYPPYSSSIGIPEAGEHTLTVTAYISRNNCFANVHCADETLKWLGPDSWRSNDTAWTYEYRLHREGLLSTPIITQK